MKPGARYLCAWLAFLAVVLVLVYGMTQAGVPFWLRNVVTFGMGWTCGRPMGRMLYEWHKAKEKQ